MTPKEQEELERVLSKPMTAIEIAKATGCTKSTIYVRLRKMGDRVVATVERRVNRTGPKPILYQMKETTKETKEKRKGVFRAAAERAREAKMDFDMKDFMTTSEAAQKTGIDQSIWSSRAASNMVDTRRVGNLYLLRRTDVERLHQIEKSGEWLTPEEAAAKYGSKPGAWRDRGQTKKIRAERVGSKWYVHAKDCEAFVSTPHRVVSPPNHDLIDDLKEQITRGMDFVVKLHARVEMLEAQVRTLEEALASFRRQGT